MYDGHPLVGVAGTSLEDCCSQAAVGAMLWTPVGWMPVSGSSWDLPGRLWQRRSSGVDARGMDARGMDTSWWVDRWQVWIS